MRTTPPSFTDSLYCTIHISRGRDENSGKTQVEGVQQEIEEEIRIKEGQSTGRCSVVVEDAGNTDPVQSNIDSMRGFTAFFDDCLY